MRGSRGGANPALATLIFGRGKIFTARHYASAVYAVVECLYVCMSVTSRHCTKTAKQEHAKTPYAQGLVF